MPDEASGTNGSAERLPRRFNHRDYLSERRQQILQQKHTDALPALPNDKTFLRQLTLLREENMRLQQQFNNAAEEIEAIHNGHRRESESYEKHINGLIAERDALQERYLQAEEQYQALHIRFESAAAEEAYRMLAEATNTTEIPQMKDAPSVEEDLKKTVELHIRQVEDQHVVQALYLARQAQHKAAQLEEQLARERWQIIQDRDKLHTMQESLRQQAEQRQQTIEAHLRAKFTATVVLITVISLVVLVVFQLIFAEDLHTTLGIALFVPIFLCFLIALMIGSLRSAVNYVASSTPRKTKAKK